MASLTEKPKGFTLVETTVAIGVLLVVIIGGLSANNITTKTVSLNKQRSQANLLAREGIEALMSVRAANFPSLTPGEFHPVFDQNGWRLVAGSETLPGNYQRSIILSSIMRSVGCGQVICNITSGGGIIDQNAYKATVRVTWQENNQNKEYSLNTFISYWR